MNRFIFRTTVGALIIAQLSACGGGNDDVNLAPTAIAGSNQTVNEQTSVTLSGSGTDSDGEVVSYSWRQTAGENVTLADASSAASTFEAPITTEELTLTFELTVTDDDGDTATDNINILVEPVNEIPVADAGSDISAEEQSSVTLAGVGTDSDGQIESYLWTQTAGTTVVLTGAESAVATFDAPDISADETLTFELSVTDNEGAVASDSIDVNLTAFQQVTLSGVVTDNVIANANVCAIVDEQTTCTDADLDGKYSLFMQFPAPDKTLLITAQGIGVQSKVVFKSQLGSAAGLVSAAGEDGILSKNENFRVNVTNVTTAKYVLIQKLLDEADTTPKTLFAKAALNGLIESDEELAQLEGAISPERTIQLAAAIKVVVDNPDFELPEGVESTLDLINDPEIADQFIAYVNETDPDAMAAAVDAIMADEELTPPVDATGIEGDYVLAFFNQFREMNESVLGFTLNADGSASVVGKTLENVAGTWSLDANAILIDLSDDPYGYSAEDCSNETGSYYCNISHDAFKIEIINDGEGYDLTKLTVSKTGIDATGVNQPISWEEVAYPNMIKTTDILAFTQEQLADKLIALPIFDSGLTGIEDSGTEQINYYSGGSTVATFNANMSGSFVKFDNTSVDFAWSINELGQLKIDVAAAGNEPAYSFTYSKLINVGLASFVAMQLDSGDSTFRINQMRTGLMIEKQQSISYQEGSVPGAYSLVFGEQEADYSTSLNLFPDGTGFEVSNEPWDDVSPVRYYFFDWVLNGGILELVYRQGANDTYFDWESAVSCITNCEQMELELIAVQGDRQYIRVTKSANGDDEAFSENFMLDTTAAPDMTSNKIAVQFFMSNTGQKVYAEAYSSDGDGTGTGVYTDPVGRSNYTETLIGRVKQLDLNLTTTSNPTLDCDGTGQIPVRQDRTLTRIYLFTSNKDRPQHVPAEAESWSNVSFWVTSYPENPACETFTEAYFRNELFAYSETDFMPIPVSAGAYAIEHQKNDFSDGSYTFAAMLELNSDGTGTAIAGRPEVAALQWTEEAGALASISLDSDQHQIYPFGSVMELPIGHLIVSIDNINGNQTTSGGMFLNKDDSFTLTESNAAGTYESVDGSFDIRYYEDGFGGLGSVDGELSWWHHWVIDGDALRSFRYVEYVDSDSNGVPDDTDSNGIPDDAVGGSWSLESSARYCATAVEGACGIYMNRSYLPIAQDNNFVYFFRDRLLYKMDPIDNYGITETEVYVDSYGSIFKFDKKSNVMSTLSMQTDVDYSKQQQVLPFEMKVKSDRKKMQLKTIN